MQSSQIVRGSDFLNQQGPTLELIRSIDWASTSIGAQDTWPQSLRSALSICINSNFPIAIYWGADLVLLYNEAWSPIPGNKHSWAFGKPAIEVWPEIWSAIEPQFQKAFAGVPGGSKDALLPMQRHGYTEECYFDFTFTPIYGESGKVEGIFNAVIETTYRVINERRAGVLQRLVEAIGGVPTFSDVFEKTSSVLREAKSDVPFFFIYEIINGQPVLVSHPPSVREPFRLWPFTEVLNSGAPKVIDDLNSYLTAIPDGLWPETPTEAIIFPIKGNGGHVHAIMVAGASSRRKIDKDYQLFFESISNLISSEIITLQSLAKERERAEALAQIDKAKTTFFSNISHEFRTPLTLMLSPLEEVLNDGQNLSTAQKQNLETSLSNSLRLQKLVNTLLDFSRIEAGKMEAKFEPTDISAITRDLASSFRSAVESSGIEYQVSINDIYRPVLLDINMWEKIVLNLISNAFKYTEKGQIKIELREEGDTVVFNVIDSGVGISDENLQKIFERFYRINNAGGRSQEGTGIGLALVKELVLLHHGEIAVQSKLGIGSTFTVKIPLKTGDGNGLSKNTKVQFEKKTLKAFVDEARKWMINQPEKQLPDVLDLSHKGSILVADDNKDMRDYIVRLLKNDYQIIEASNGEDAFALAQQSSPDLIISDIMMPKLDGFGLLKKLKSNFQTRSIPLIFLSARAGEEAKIEGIQAGADDYLVKPFSSKELLARVTNQIATNTARRKTEKEFFNLFVQSPAHINIFRGPEHVIEFFHPFSKRIVGREVTGQKIREALPEMEGQGYFELLDEVYHNGRTVSLPESKGVFPDENGKPVERYFHLTYLPWRALDGTIQGVLQFSLDVTEQVMANFKIKESEERFRVLANSISQIVWITDPTGKMEYLSDQWKTYTGQETAEGLSSFAGLIHDEDRQKIIDKWVASLEDGLPWQAEYRLKSKGGDYRWFFGHTVPLKDEQGRILKWIGSASDIQHQKEVHFELEALVADRTSELRATNDQLRRSNEDLQQFAHVTSHDLKEPVRKIKMYGNILSTEFASYLPEKGRDYLSKIDRATGRVSAMIDGVLQYSTIDMTDQFLKEIDLNAVVKTIIEDLEIPIKEHGAVVTFNNLPSLKGYPTLIHQLFYNLINNSLKFRRSGVKPEINISHAALSEADRHVLNGNYFKIMLEDNGVGFDQAYAEKIFESFTRLHPKDKYEGTGLGLALCRKIILRHNGLIKASGTLNKGACFTLYFPDALLS
jgi:PAS domain S-box-containing protein